MHRLPLLRTTEFGSIAVPELRLEQRRAIHDAARNWQVAHNLGSPPLSFAGVDGSTLVTTQHVGVISAGGVCVEIFPKLDRHVLRTGLVNDAAAATVMRQLLWMMHAAGHLDVVEADTVSLAEQPARFFDLFAWLLGANLQRALSTGVFHHYTPRTDDLRTVCGRIDFSRQLTRNWDRLDRIACRWDEFSADTPLNRVFKTACRYLTGQSQHSEANRLLTDCITMLDEVSDVSVTDVLAQSRAIPWPRGAERFRNVFNFARQLLSGVSQDTLAGHATSFTWLIDMNVLFEEFVAAAVSARFGVPVRKQHHLGTLLQLSRGGIAQYADTYWHDANGALWVGDAKYKRINADQAWNDVLAPSDVRQLTTYGGMARSAATRRCVALFYPCVGESPLPKTATTWNQLEFHLIPVRLHEVPDLADVLPPLEALTGKGTVGSQGGNSIRIKQS